MSFAKSLQKVLKLKKTTNRVPIPNQPHNRNNYHKIKLLKHKTHKHHNHNINTNILVTKWKSFKHLKGKIISGHSYLGHHYIEED